MRLMRRNEETELLISSVFNELDRIGSQCIGFIALPALIAPIIEIDRPIKIGSAYMDRGRCLPWSGNGPCIVCQEVCPTSPKAVYLKKEAVSGGDKTTLVDVPYVDLKKCVGCGICETKCPVKGRPAIRIIAAGESRSIENQILLPDLVP